MVTLTAGQYALLVQLINEYLLGTAPEAQGVHEKVAHEVGRIAVSIGFLPTLGAWMEAIRDRPVTLLLQLISFIGSPFNLDPLVPLTQWQVAGSPSTAHGPFARATIISVPLATLPSWATSFVFNIRWIPEPETVWTPNAALTASTTFPVHVTTDGHLVPTPPGGFSIQLQWGLTDGTNVFLAPWSDSLPLHLS